MKNLGTLKVTTLSEREIVMTRVFDAPQRMVFDAFTKPELLRRWFGPRGWSMDVCEVDLKVGGTFRFVLRGPDGKTMGMRGVYREIAAPGRTVAHGVVRRFPWRFAGYFRADRTGRQNNPDGDGFVSDAGNSRRRDPIRHGARSGGELRQTGRDAAGKGRHPAPRMKYRGPSHGTAIDYPGRPYGTQNLFAPAQSSGTSRPTAKGVRNASRWATVGCTYGCARSAGM